MARSKIKRILLLYILTIFSTVSWAEENRYVVFFSDKANSAFSIDLPTAFLSQRAIDRRAKRQTPITSEDFPVNQNYIDSLIKYNVKPYFTSRWFNAVLVEAEESQLIELMETSYITAYEYVAPGTKLNADLQEVELSYNALVPSIVSSNSINQLTMLAAQTMHSEGYTGKGVHIAVLDGGFSKVNESAVFGQLFEDDRLIDRLNFTTNSQDVFSIDDHGTNALSCIVSDYKEVLLGTGYNADISLYVTEDVSDGGRFEYRIEEYNWLFAAERADSAGVDIISSSLGYNIFEDSDMNYVQEDMDGETALISRAAALASDKGILVVSSAGNEGNKTWQYVTPPADVADVLAVGAVNSSGVRSSFSSIGPTADGRIKPDVVALGQGVAVFHDDNSIGTNNGTSFSAPLIAGFAAGLWQQFPELNNLEIKELIASIGSQHANPDNELGHGLPNYLRVIGDSVLSVSSVFEDSFTVFPNPFTGNYISIQVEREYARKELNVTLYAPDGKIVAKQSPQKVRKGEVLTLPVTGNSSGIYILHLQSGSETKNVKLLRY